MNCRSSEKWLESSAFDDLEKRPPGLYLAVGEARLPRWFLSELAPALAHGLRVSWVDAGNSFDAYGLSYAARTAGFAPQQVLRQVAVARPFNLFQLETMVCRKLPALWRGEPIVLSDPLAVLHDDEVELKDAARVFARVREGIKALPALWLTLAVTRRAPPGRERWLDLLIEDSDAHAFLLPHGKNLTHHHPDPA